MQKGNSQKLNRVNEELKKEISNIINYKLKNSKVTGLISVTKVKTTPDLKYARVYISAINKIPISKWFKLKNIANPTKRTNIAKDIRAKSK